MFHFHLPGLSVSSVWGVIVISANFYLIYFSRISHCSEPANDTLIHFWALL